MESPIKILIEILNDEKKIIENLINISQNKTNMLACSNIDGINDIAEQEQKIKLAMDTIEKKRVNTVAEIASFLEIGPDITITDIIDKIDEPFKSELMKGQQEVRRLLCEYKEVNGLNLDLIQSHLKYVDYMVNILSGQRMEVPTYGAKGYTQHGEERKIFDNKV